MSLRTSLTDAFNIRPGEGLPILLLGSYSFLAGFCLAYVISLGNASFLVAFGTAYLPKGYIATGVTGYLVGAGLSVLQRRLAFSKLIVVCIGLLLLVTCAFWIGYRFPADLVVHGLRLGQWLALGLFVGIGPYIMLIYFVFRSVAGRLFDLRQGKRLFGLISTGDVLSSMVGFFSVPVLLRIVPEANDLLLIAAASLCLCLWVLLVIRRKFSDKLSDPAPAQKTGGVSGVWGMMFGSRYFLLLVGLAAATVVGFYYIDYVFLGQLQTRFSEQKMLAQFIGIFYGVIRIVEFILKSFVSGRLINQYGLRFGLVVLPTLLCACSAVAALLAFAGLPSIVFLVLSLDKLIERVVTKSLYDPAFSVLYQPIDSKLRLSVQTRIEGIVQQITVVAAGGSMLLFSWVGSSQLVLNVLVVVFVAWLTVAALMNRAYRESLLRHLRSQSRADLMPGQDEVSALVLADHIGDALPERARLARDLFEQIDPFAASGASGPNAVAGRLSERLDDADLSVRRAALMAASQTPALLTEVIGRLDAPGVGNAAVAGLLSAGDAAVGPVQNAFQDPARSPVAHRRLARILGSFEGDDAAEDLLSRITASDRAVRRQALTSLRLRGFVARAGQASLIRQEIEATIDVAAWCMAALLDLESVNLPLLKAAVGLELDENRERLFRLLSLIYDARHIEMVRESFKTGSNDGKVYALELIDVFVDQDIKAGLFPILDDLALGQRLKRLEERFPQQRLSVPDRLKDIVNRPYGHLEVWTRACALEGMAHVKAQAPPNELIATLFHADPLLRETAAWALNRLDAGACEHHLSRLSKAVRGALADALHTTEKPALLFERIRFLKGLPAFAAVPEFVLVEPALAFEPVAFELGAPVFSPQDRQLVALVEGRVRLQSGAETVGLEEPGSLLCRWTSNDDVRAFAEAPVRALTLSEGAFCDFVADYVELAQGLLQSANESMPAADVSLLATL